MPLNRTLLVALLICTLLSQEVMAWSTTRTNTYHEKENTHLWILHNAINLMKLNERNGIEPIELDYLCAWKKALERGIHHADWLCLCNTFYLYGNHYYDPDTGKSFIPTKTAKDMGINFFKKAGVMFKKGKLKKAFFYLGLSLHYVTDITQPMHVALFTDWNLSMPFYHNQFEEYAAKIQNQFSIKGQTNLTTESNDPEVLLYVAAKKAKEQHTHIVNKKIRNCYLLGFINKHYRHRWKEQVTTVIGNQLVEAQILTAQFIHLWFQTYVL